MRYFLLDKLTELVPGERAAGVKCVTLTDEVLHDHFPEHPILPGTLILEGGAQLAGVLLETTFNRPDQPLRRALLVQVRRAKFHETVGPGDTLELRVTLTSQLQTAAEIELTASVGTKKIARAELTFVLKEIASERVHEQRRWLYRLWTRELPDAPELL